MDNRRLKQEKWTFECEKVLLGPRIDSFVVWRSRENSSHIMRRVQTAAMDGIATEDTAENGISLTELHISEMWVEDSEELYFYWRKLKKKNTC